MGKDKLKSAAEIRLKQCWDLIEQTGTIKFSDLPKLEEAFTKALLKIEELTKSRDKWSDKYYKLKKDRNI
tara:strand:- start:310 stop:519 length:210 start_codon:yes stop_codon:yes gene_type:complete